MCEQLLKAGCVNLGYGAEGLLFGDHVFSVSREGDSVIIMEECDGYFFEKMTPPKAISSLEKVIEHIEREFPEVDYV